MGRVDDVVQCFCRGTACSHAILAHYGPSVGLTAEQGMKLASGFAGGMRLAQTCGAVTGAFMVSTSEGAQRATQKGLFRTICPRLVQDAAEILEEML